MNIKCQFYFVSTQASARARFGVRSASTLDCEGARYQDLEAEILTTLIPSEMGIIRKYFIDCRDF
jgi:hypothetical protein